MAQHCIEKGGIEPARREPAGCKLARLQMRQPYLFMRCPTLATLALFSTGALSATEFLPLQPGNYWTYRPSAGGDPVSIRVGTQALIGGQVYHRLTGYATQPLWVRAAENGNLFFRDEEFDRDILLTSFEIVDRAWFEAPFRPCEQQGQALAERRDYQGPAGRFTAAVAIRYRVLNCADTGVEEELYLENVGMLRRTVTTIAGPRSYDLVQARIGNMVLGEAPSAGLQVSASLSPEANRILATLRFVKVGGAPITLQWASSQEHELVLRNSAGEVLYRWSDGRAFLPVVRDEVLDAEFVRTIPIDLQSTLSGGVYTLEAWLTAGSQGREFSASVAFEVPRPQ
jgi:intracellular proteinase inhibitor BsuPI